jgi:integrase
VGHRDATAILLACRHGLRVSELVALSWDDIDFTTGKVHVRRAKGRTSVHQMSGKELRALRRLQQETPEAPGWLLEQARQAGFPFLVHSHSAVCQGDDGE